MPGFSSAAINNSNNAPRGGAMAAHPSSNRLVAGGPNSKSSGNLNPTTSSKPVYNGPQFGKDGKPVQRMSAASDPFPKMPLVSEMEKNREKFLTKLDGLATKPPQAEEFSGKQKLSLVDEPGAMFAEADTRVFIRCRPILQHETDRVPAVTKVPGHKDVLLLAPKVDLAGGCTVNPYPLPVDNTFSASDTNAEVYSYLSELVDLALRGGSASMMCYGQTGSGKTFTSMGLLQNMAGQLEAAIRTGKVEVCATFVELHHEGCRDLISGEADVNICEVGNKIELQRSRETTVSSASNFLDLVGRAIGNRSTKATLRNAGSSRSHMVVRILVKDVETPWANPGILCLADLAGSESTGDAKEHDKERVIETKFINSSLMTLKDCIRARGVAATSSKHVHIPYRQTSLTLILKDSFELVVKRPTKAAVIACVSPLFMDIRHTGNTVRYASLLYVSPKKRIVMNDDPEDPNCWDRSEALARLQKFGGTRIAPEHILPEGDGRALVLIPEAEFIRRVMDNSTMGEKQAQTVYGRVWKAVVDARTRTRKEALKLKKDPVKDKENADDLRRMISQVAK